MGSSDHWINFNFLFGLLLLYSSQKTEAYLHRGILEEYFIEKSDTSGRLLLADFLVFSSAPSNYLPSIFQVKTFYTLQTVSKTGMQFQADLLSHSKHRIYLVCTCLHYLYRTEF